MITRRLTWSMVAAAAVGALSGCASSAPLAAPIPSISSSASASGGSTTTSPGPGYQPGNNPASLRVQASGLTNDYIQSGMPNSQVVQSAHGIVIGDASMPVLRAVSADLESGLSFDQRLTGEHVNGKVLMLAPRTQDEFESIDTAPYGTVGILGVTVTPSDGASWVAIDTGGPSGDGRQLGADSTQLTWTITHELFHYLTLPDGFAQIAYGVPLWLTEGAAEEAAGDQAEFLPLVRDPAVQIRLPTDADLRGPHAGDYYEIAAAFISYLAQEYGRSTEMSFYKDVISHNVQPDIPGMFKKAFGTDFATAQKQFIAEYEKQLKST